MQIVENRVMKTEKRKAPSENKHWNTLLLSLLITVIWFGIYCRLSDFVYAGNDDFYLKALASGEVTGTPECRLFFMNIWYGLLLKGFYTVFPRVSWYGVFYLVLLVITIFLFLYKLLSLLPRGSYVLSACGIVVVFTVLYRHTVQLQFTTIACILAAMGIFWFLCSDMKQGWKTFLRQNIGTFCFLGVSYCIRDMSCLMMMLIAGPLFLGKLAAEIWGKKDTAARKEALRSAAAFLAVVIGVIGFLAGSQKLAYAGQEWKDYTVYSHSRAEIHDYAGYPDYETYQEIYARYGISRESYTALSQNYLMVLDQNIQAEALSELAKISTDRSGENDSFPQKLQTMWYHYTGQIGSESGRPLNGIAVLLYLLLLLASLLCKDLWAFADTCLVFVGSRFIWFYLLWINRFPLRVTQGLLLAEVFALLGVGIAHKLWRLGKTYKVAETIVLFALCLVLWRWGDLRSYADNNHATLEFSKSYEEIQQYCMADSDKFYLLDVLSFSYFTESAVQPQVEIPVNQMLLGGWLSGSPWYQQKMQDVGITNLEQQALTEPIYFVFMEAEGVSNQYLENYYGAKYQDLTWEIVDRVETSGGVNFNIYQVRQTQGE